MAKSPVSKPLQSSKKGVSKQTSSQVLKARNFFYRDGERKVFTALLLMGVVTLLSVGIAVYNLIQSPRVVYAAVHPDGTLVEMVAMDQPNLSDAAVINWTSTAIAEIFNYSHFDWQKRLDQSTSEYMTASGKEKFLQMLKQSGILKAVVDNNMYSSLVVSETPIIMNKGVVGGSVYAWQFKVPVTITYRTVRASKSSNSTMVITVARANNVDYSNGVAIAAISMVSETISK